MHALARTHTHAPTNTQVQTRSLVPTAFMPPADDDLPQLEEERPEQESVNLSAQESVNLSATASLPEASQAHECGHGIAVVGSSPSHWKHRISVSVTRKSNAPPSTAQH